MTMLTIRPSKVQRPDGSVKKQARLIGTTTAFNAETGKSMIVSSRIDIDDDLALDLLESGKAVLVSNVATSAAADEKLYNQVELYVPGGDDTIPAKVSSGG